MPMQYRITFEIWMKLRRRHVVIFAFLGIGCWVLRLFWVAHTSQLFPFFRSPAHQTFFFCAFQLLCRHVLWIRIHRKVWVLEKKLQYHFVENWFALKRVTWHWMNFCNAANLSFIKKYAQNITLPLMWFLNILLRMQYAYRDVILNNDHCKIIFSQQILLKFVNLNFRMKLGGSVWAKRRYDPCVGLKYW